MKRGEGKEKSIQGETVNGNATWKPTKRYRFHGLGEQKAAEEGKILIPETRRRSRATILPNEEIREEDNGEE